MKCKNLRIREKNYKKFGYCKLYQKEVPIFCNKCSFDVKYDKEKINKSYKQPLISKTTFKGKKHNLTKATEIPKKVKLAVWERDNHECIFCGTPVPWNMANSHFIKRSHLGLGIEQNIMTNCFNCHKKFEEESKNGFLHEKARKYFREKYSNWDEEKLIYKKYSTDYG